MLPDSADRKHFPHLFVMFAKTIQFKRLLRKRVPAQIWTLPEDTRRAFA